MIEADPNGGFEGRTRHAAECGDCASYAASLALFERRIARALAIPVPELPLPELPPLEAPVGADLRPGDPADGGRGSDAAVPAARGPRTGWRPGWQAPVWLGLAASLVLALVFVPRLGTGPGSGELALAAEVIGHMGYEPYAERVTDEPVADGRLRQVVGPDAERIDREVGLISYARTCVIGGEPVPHLVVQGEDGPVTILLMPHERVDGPISLDDGGYHGAILPVGEGSIAVLARKGHSLERVKERVTLAMGREI